MINKLIDWLIDLNVVSTNFELYYTKELGNCIHCMFISNIYLYSF